MRKTRHDPSILIAVCGVVLLLAAAAPLDAANTAADEVGPGANAGAYINGPARGRDGAIAGDENTATYFHGVNWQYVRVSTGGTDIEGFGLSLERFTVEFWFKATASNVGKGMLGTLNDDETTFMQVERDRRGFNLAFRSESGNMMRVFMSPEASSTMTDGRYHHAVWVVTSASAGKAKVYLDGREDVSGFVSGSAPGGFARFQYDLAIGATNDRGVVGQWITAALDEVALYARVLSAARVKRHYAGAVQGAAGVYAREVMKDTPFAYWRLGEPSREGLQLLLDGRVVEKVDNAVLRLGRVTKHPDNPLFGQEHPWEPRFDNMYPNVMYDEVERLYKAWYSMFVIDAASSGTPPKQRTPGTYMKRVGARSDGLGYATSRDGIRWTKPMMTVYPWGGKPSNLVARHVHGAGILKDLPERDPARRYKMFFKGRSMSVRFSPDGVRWGAYIACPEIEAAGDAHNNALWVPELKRYVGFTRQWNSQRRVVARTESHDFVHWTKSVEVFRGKHLFDVYSMPVFRYGNVYLGLPTIFNERADRAHTELAWSPDTIHWYRIDEGNALIPNSQKKGDYDWGTVYASFPILLDNEIRLYYGGCNGGHFDWRDGFLCLATLRPDGFAGYEPSDNAKPAMVVTKPLRLGAKLRITADARGGSITVAALDETGEVLLTGRPVTNNVTDRTVSWGEGGRTPKSLVGRKVRLQFVINRAKLYSFLP